MTAYAALFATINEKTTILTPNRRLASTLHALYQQQQLSQQKTAWLTPDILPITTWFERLWLNHVLQSSSPAPLVLNQAQEQAIWEEIVITSLNDNPLLQVTETAEIAKKAWALVLHWHVDINQPLFNCQNDYIFLKKWAQLFEKKCSDNNWIASALLPIKITELVKNKQIILPEKIFLVGFTELAPAFNKLFDLCNAESTVLDCHPEQNTLLRTEFEQPEDEITTIALWAKQQYANNISNRIGCVIPTLSENRDRIEQIFHEIFNDALHAINISAGKALIEYPLIHHALQLITLHSKKLNQQQIHLFLNTPFIAAADSERDKRGQLDALLSHKNILSIRIRDQNDQPMLTEIAIYLSTAPILAKKIRKLIIAADITNLHPYRYWAKHFNDLLTLIGWPGEKTLISEEYQIIEQWLKILEQLSSFDYILPNTSFTNALFALKKIASQHIFQPKTPDAPVQILGLLEAAGLPFDHLWISGMNDFTWPSPPKPNPLIPKQIQRELGMPHSSADRELNYAINLTQQFKAASPILIFSYAKKIDQIEAAISPILNDIKTIHYAALISIDYHNPTEVIFTAKSLEVLSDDIAPPLIHDGNIIGGVDVIKQQAECPFKAFAIHRLQLKAVDSAELGLRPKERGSIIHMAMEIIWHNLQNQQQLIALPDEELLELIDAAIGLALEKTSLQIEDKKNLLEIEKKRLTNIIYAWLQLEKEREPFAVHSLEEKMSLAFDKVNFELRIDRIDKLDNNDYLIIDYKTGKENTIHSWFEQRLDNPQLPLYAIINTHILVNAISFAQIHAIESKFVGVSHNEINISGIKPITTLKNYEIASWQSQIEQWKKILSQICLDYLAGKANVDPKDKNQTCKWCHLPSLCRINEAT